MKLIPIKLFAVNIKTSSCRPVISTLDFNSTDPGPRFSPGSN